IIQFNLNAMIETIIPLIPSDPHLETAPFFISIFANILRAIGVVAGITLVIIAYPLWNGESWPYPIAISCISLPTIFSVIVTLPYVVHVGFPPPSGIILVVGLVTFWVLLWLKNGDQLEKIARIVVLTLMGVTAGQINVLVMHGAKAIFDTEFNLTDPSIIDLKEAIFGLGSPMNFIALTMLILAIPLLIAGKKSGWYLGLIAGVTVVFINIPTQIIRWQVSGDFSFITAGIFGLLLVISLLIPTFKEKLIGIQ
ncbi:MAG: hypothetical protein ACFFFH_20905, partial [Candidatus Thorarchaeota archaeon]